MSAFNPGDKVIKRNETDPKNYGEVMDLPAVQMKEGYIAVYFKRHVWIKPENLMHFDEWKRRRQRAKRKEEPSRLLVWDGKGPLRPENIKNYWSR